MKMLTAVVMDKSFVFSTSIQRNESVVLHQPATRQAPGSALLKFW